MSRKVKPEEYMNYDKCIRDDTNTLDAVSRQEVIDTIDKWVKAENILETLPTDKVTPLFKSVHKLPLETEEKSNFCPNCGAKMEEGGRG